MQCQAVPSLLKSDKETAEGVLEIEIKDEEIRNCSLMTVSYCSDIPDANSMSAVAHEAGER